MNDIIFYLYWQCTDFCLNAANFIGISYVEFNFMLFVVGMPMIVLVLLGLNIYKYFIRQEKQKV